MDLTPFRALFREAQFATHGVPAVVTPPDADPVETRVIWADREAAQVPPDGTFRRAEPRRLLGIRRDDVPRVPRGTLVAVTEHLSSSPALWRVDAIERSDPDHFRVIVVPNDLET
jgi:hypothetical protein